MNSLDLLPSSAALPVAGELGRDARRVSRILWRGKTLVAAILVLALVPTILYLRQAPRLYAAAVKIMIQAPETNDVLSDRSLQATTFRLTEDVIQTEVELISSSLLARRTVERLGLENDPEFNAALRKPTAFSTLLAALNPLPWLSRHEEERKAVVDLSPEARQDLEKAGIARAFLRQLTVQAQRRAFIITVQFTSEDREKAARIANTVADVYVHDRLEASFSEARQITTWLGERLKTLQQDVVVAEAAVERFRSEHGLRRSADRQGTVGDQQLSELNSKLVLARTEMAQKQARLQQVRTLTKSRGNYETSSDVLQSQLIQRLREQESTKSREMSEALKTYGDRHPRIIGLKADLEDLRAKIQLEIDRIAASFANDVEIAATGLASLERGVAELRRQTNVAGETAVRLRDLERQADASRNLYEMFLSRFKREGEQANMRRANARIVSPADIPVSPSSPATLKILAVVGLSALAAGVLLVFFIDNLDNTLRSSDDAEELSGLPVLAIVPRLRKGADRPMALISGDPHSALVDAMRGLRTALLGRDENDQPRTVLVTSSIPKEGKTFASVCLATVFARTGERVLLIDADVYRPRLHTLLGLANEGGLVEALTGEAEYESLVQPLAGSSLDFLSAGRSAHLGEIVQAHQFEAFLRRLEEHYGRIVIDSPPILAVADVQLFARQVDKVVYLVKWGGTPRDAVHNGIKLLRSVGAPLAGLVLSQVDQRKHASYGYGDYGQYYGRYSDYYGKS
ncbi:MAG: polysaccharide biosynthesis tyrosine autokinase [Alphaproteobacteria bacterium]